MVNPSYQKSATVADERRKGFKGKNLKQISGAMLRAARADNTQRSYKSARTQFQSWCSSEGIKPLEITGEQLGEYLCWLAVEKEYPPASIRAKLAGIRRWFRDEQGRDNVTVSDHVLQVWSGIQRQFAQRPSQAKALTIDIIREIINVLPDRDGTWSIKAIRDRALMLVGYGCAFRRSELSGLRVDDVEFQEAGVTLFLRKSKTDQHSRGEWIGLGCGTGPTCPVAALRAWLDVAPAGEWVFRGVDRWGHVSPEPLTDHAINLLVRGWSRCWARRITKRTQLTACAPAS